MIFMKQIYFCKNKETNMIATTNPSNKKTQKDSYTHIFLIIALFLQIFCYALDFLYQSLQTNNVLLQLFSAIKSTITNNWLPFSIFFIIFIFVDVFYHIITKKRTRISIKLILTICNILFCINFFDTIALQEKLAYFSAHIVELVVFIIMLIVGIVLIYITKKIFNAVQNKQSVNNEIKKEYDAKKSKEKDLPEINDTDQILNHPFYYIYQNYKYYEALKKASKFQAKYTKKAKKYTNPDGQGNDHSSTVFSFMTALLTVPFFAIIIFVVLFEIGVFKNEDKNYELIENIINSISNTIIHITQTASNGLNGIEEALMALLLVLGVPILMSIIVIIIAYSGTFIVKLWKHIHDSFQNKDQHVESFASNIKLFFFDTADSVLKLLLFIPDFLSTIEDTVFDFASTEVIEDVEAGTPDDSQTTTESEPLQAPEEVTKNK